MCLISGDYLLSNISAEVDLRSLPFKVTPLELFVSTMVVMPLSRYPYIDMLDDVESIIESRARSADLSVNNYYDFLYR